ncbi:HNH endonuclease [Microbacterium azadirachtae]|uniref:HNH endonuclease signature motif containing protein n=1 Tax=Microbacterium azadirachtae TaxID=582680 RepID=UPI0005EC8E86|nr:HNH endonuclease signature motif containing protein [Microbacterium azadirachtae]UXW87159.1 HNH endonuclease [Microbacterium azadirachtae]
MPRHTRPPVADRTVLLDAWVAKRARIARLEAEAADLLATRAALFDQDVAEHPVHRDMARRSMIAEYAAAGHIGSGAVESAFADAEALSMHFPGVHDALRRGTIAVQHVRAILSASDPVRDAVRNRRIDAAAFVTYEQACLAVAERDSPTRTRVTARQIAAVIAGGSLSERHRRALDERCVTVRPLDEGMALLTAVLPEVYAVAIKDRLRRVAKAITGTSRDRAPGKASASPSPDAASMIPDGADREERSASDELFPATGGRTGAQLEADALVDLLLAADPSDVLGAGPDSIRATVQVTVAATTLTGEDERLAELDGHGPLLPDIAREFARTVTGWNRLFLDPEGVITAVDRYTPTEAMKRLLRARDQRCRFPGCPIPVTRCEIDHNHDYAKGGRTEPSNLADFCPSHHPLKHPDLHEVLRWTAHQLPDGAVRWTSPLGRSYDDHPPRRVMFT